VSNSVSHLPANPVLFLALRKHYFISLEMHVATFELLATKDRRTGYRMNSNELWSFQTVRCTA